MSYIGTLLEALSMTARGIEAGRNRAISAAYQRAYQSYIEDQKQKGVDKGRALELQAHNTKWNKKSDKAWQGNSVVDFLNKKHGTSHKKAPLSLSFNFDDKIAREYNDNTHVLKHLPVDSEEITKTREYDDYDANNNPTGKKVIVGSKRLFKKIDKKFKKHVGADLYPEIMKHYKN